MATNKEILGWDDETFWTSSPDFLFKQLDIFLKRNEEANKRLNNNNNSSQNSNDGWTKLERKPPGID